MQNLHRRWGACWRLLGLLLTLTWSALAWAQSATLTLLTVNDVYELTPVQGRGGLAELMTLLRAERANATHTLTTVNGDFLSPSLMSSLFKGAQMVAGFNALGVDLVVFGNHEFDLGPDVTRQRMAESTFTWLGSNVLGPDGQPFGGAQATVTRQVGGMTVGFFGVLTPDTARISSPGPSLTFTPVIPAAQAAVQTLRQAGAEVIIALTHLTIAEDRALARAVPGISVILGGHDHEPITWYEGNTLIHKSGQDAQFLGRVDLLMHKTPTAQGSQVTVTTSWRMLANRGVTPDPAIAALVAPYVTQLDQALGAALGTSSTALDSRTSAVRSQETSMGNLLTDALREGLQADVALLNGGGIRGNRLYAAGTTLTQRDILQELPFGNIGVLVELSGADLLATLEHSLGQLPEPSGRFLHVAGLRLTYTPTRPPGQRVRAVQVGDQALDPAATYRVATSDYLLKGGDGYTSLTRGTVRLDATGGRLLTTTIMEIVRGKGAVAPQVEGRIVARPD